MKAVEVTLKGIHVIGPELAELVEPLVHLLKRFRLQPVEAALGVHGGFNETGVAKHAEVLRNGGLRHLEPALDLADGLLGRDEEAQNGAAVGFGDDLEGGFHALDIPCHVYTCQGIF